MSEGMQFGAPSDWKVLVLSLEPDCKRSCLHGGTSGNPSGCVGVVYILILTTNMKLQSTSSPNSDLHLFLAVGTLTTVHQEVFINSIVK